MGVGEGKTEEDLGFPFYSINTKVLGVGDTHTLILALSVSFVSVSYSCVINYLET